MFITPAEILDVFIHIKPVDFRKGINGLGNMISTELGNQERGKNIFVFINRNRDKLKILYWDDTGFALWQKVLEKEKFKWPTSAQEKLIISPGDLKFLLSGYSIIKQKPHKKTITPTTFY